MDLNNNQEKEVMYKKLDEDVKTTRTPNDAYQYHRIKKNVKKKNSTSSTIIKLFAFFIICVLLSSFAYSIAYYIGKNGFNLNNTISSFNNRSELSRSNISRSAISVGSLEFAESNDALTVKDIIDKNLSSVISIRLKTSTQGFGAATGSSGTGFFVTDDGLIITNRHVVAQACNANSSFGGIEITGLTFDNQALDLEILTIDPVDDLAILKVKDEGAQTFNPVTFADSSKTGLGTEVIAIGNVLGEFSNSVTKGIISGLNRSLNTELRDECTGNTVFGDGLIQTDAAINQGNSGGPLFDAAGNVVGINTFGATQAQNIGFALPSQTIVQAINSFKEFNQITKPRLGVVTRPLDPALQLQYPWIPSDYGELIYSPNGNSVLPGSGAEAAGLSEGDILLEINDQEILSDLNGNSTLRREILKYKPGEEITLKVLKVNGRNNQNGYDYENQPSIINVTLGSIDFDFGSSNNI